MSSHGTWSTCSCAPGPSKLDIGLWCPSGTMTGGFISSYLINGNNEAIYFLKKYLPSKPSFVWEVVDSVFGCFLFRICLFQVSQVFLFLFVTYSTTYGFKVNMCLQHSTKMVPSLFAFHRWENTEQLSAFLRPGRKTMAGGGRILWPPSVDIVCSACLSVLPPRGMVSHHRLLEQLRSAGDSHTVVTSRLFAMQSFTG